ncbi:helix-turn-helix domain-containing protein [Paenibacillus sp. ACRRX]|uniref:helix-turn-helix domain-containing protein n=1 Tax=Paenibacillus sp. ACRRX TaxID=2918206 RepID=UPI001EF6BA33|nr:helix-turn-helix domain-containing protein [Paenibacillus sp. ACRRX]
MSVNSFGSYLKMLREKKEMTIKQLSEESGISNAQISRIENGIRKPPKPETIKKLSEALGADYKEMLTKAGHFEEDASEYPDWASEKDILDFKTMLENDSPVLFDGVPIEGEARQRVLDVLTGLFWEEKRKDRNNPNTKKEKGK